MKKSSVNTPAVFGNYVDVYDRLLTMAQQSEFIMKAGWQK